MGNVSGALPVLSPGARRWLMECAQARPADRVPDLPKLTAAEWPGAVAHARQHSVASLLRRLLEAAGRSAEVPVEVRNHLLAIQHRTEYQNRLFAAEHASVMCAFQEARVEAMVPKGLSLAEQIYGNLALRPLLDLVYLVPPRQLAAAERALERFGYGPRSRSGGDRLHRWLCPGRLWARKGQMALAVYVFTGLVNWPRFHRLDPEGVWDRSREVRVGGAPTRVPGLEDQLLYLALQIDNNGFFNRVVHDRVPAEPLVFASWSNNRVIRFADLYNLIDSHGGQVDWEALAARARRSGLLDPLSLCLASVNELWDPVAPIERLALGGSAVYVSAARRIAAATLRAAWQRSGSARRGELYRIVGLVETALPPRSALRAAGAAPPTSRLGHLARTLGRTFQSLRNRDGRPAPRERPAPTPTPATSQP